MKKIVLGVMVLLLTLSQANAYIDSKNKATTGCDCIGGIMETKEVRASHILVETEAQALDIKERVEKGENFGDLAAKYSSCPSGARGGDLGYFTRGQMVKPFEDAAFTLPVDKVSEPVKTQFGYHLIIVTDKK